MVKLKPQLQVQISRQLIADIVLLYGLKMVSFKIAKQGIENTTALIKTNKGNYALRVYRKNKKSANHIQQEIDFMEFLNEHNLPVPRIHRNLKRSTITQFKIQRTTWNCILMELMRGKGSQGYSDTLISDMAGIQAKMHNLGIRFAKTQSKKPSLETLKENEFTEHIQTSKLRRLNVIDFIHKAKSFTVKLNHALPRGYNHLDYDTHGNILVENNRVSAVLDFDDLMYSPVVVCLGYTIWNVLASTHNIHKAFLYLAEYEKTRELNKIERATLKDIILFRNYVIGSQAILFSGETTKEMRSISTVEKILQNTDFNKTK